MITSTKLKLFTVRSFTKYHLLIPDVDYHLGKAAEKPQPISEGKKAVTGFFKIPPVFTEEGCPSIRQSGLSLSQK